MLFKCLLCKTVGRFSSTKWHIGACEMAVSGGLLVCLSVCQSLVIPPLPPSLSLCPSRFSPHEGCHTVWGIFTALSFKSMLAFEADISIFVLPSLKDKWMCSFFCWCQLIKQWNGRRWRQCHLCRQPQRLHTHMMSLCVCVWVGFHLYVFHVLFILY